MCWEGPSFALKRDEKTGITCRWGPVCPGVCRKHNHSNPLKRAVGGDMIRFSLKGPFAYSVETSQRGTCVYPGRLIEMLLQYPWWEEGVSYTGVVAEGWRAFQETYLVMETGWVMNGRWCRLGIMILHDAPWLKEGDSVPKVNGRAKEARAWMLSSTLDNRAGDETFSLFCLHQIYMLPHAQ